jgi:hypothetical protein
MAMAGDIDRNGIDRQVDPTGLGLDRETITARIRMSWKRLRQAPPRPIRNT